MRILVVCGAGASSTFVALRVRRAAQEQGRAISAVAGTEASLPIDLDAADVLLVGPHLHPTFDRIREAAAAHGVRAVLLPEDVFDDLDGTRTLALVESELATDPAGPADRQTTAQTQTSAQTEGTLP